MRLSEALTRVLVVAPHADDEALGCGGLLARLRDQACATHVIYLAVDGFRHYGYEGETTYDQRLSEIRAVTSLLGCTYEIAYGDRGLMEKLDTVPRRELVDRMEDALNKHRPELLLLPSGHDYDQDHVAAFDAGFAAARPIAEVFGKWLVPHVMTYESAKLNWAHEPSPRVAASCDISTHLETKLDAMRLYASQLRPSPHIRSLEAVTALAELRGKEIGVRYAEAFGVLRTVI
jgi:LmbE family N-acetylglucosaminyl deacetylase